MLTPGRILRGVGTALLAVVVVLAALGLAPFALREVSTAGPVADTASELPGEAQAVTAGLRALGYSCSDAVRGAAAVTRSCSRVRGVATSHVQVAAATDTGTVQLVRTFLDQDRRSRAEAHADVLGVVARAVGLPPAAQAQVVAAASSREDETVVDLDWGTAVVRTSTGTEAPDSTLTAAGRRGPGVQPSPTTLAVPVDALAGAARAHGYTCSTPQVQTVRGCERTVDGYFYDLWLQGTDTLSTSVYLSVTATYQRRTRSLWLRTMDEVLGWVDTGQTRAVRGWLAGSADAPGADGYVGGLHVSFLVRDDAWTKETFGGISTECARFVEDISGCDP